MVGVEMSFFGGSKAFRRLSCAGLFCLGVAGGASAEVAVRAQPTVPEAHQLALFTSKLATGYQWKNNNTGSREIGQSFRADFDSVVDSFSFAVAGNVQPGASESPFTVKIYESRSDTSLGKLISTQSGTFLSSKDNPVNPGWVTFDVEDLKVAAGQYYTFILSWDKAGVVRQDQLFLHSGEGFVSGRLWQSNNSALPRSSSVNDLLFCVTATAESAGKNSCRVILPQEARFLSVSDEKRDAGWFLVQNPSLESRQVQVELKLHLPDESLVSWETGTLTLAAGEDRRIALPANYLKLYGLYHLEYRLLSEREDSEWDSEVFCLYPENAQPKPGESVMPIGFTTGAPFCTSRLFELAKSLGFEFYRFNAPWSNVQPSPSVWNWELMDSRLAVLKEYGFRWHAMTTWSVPWAAAKRSDPPDAAAWHNWITALAFRYGPQIAFWEVWNEPNIGFFTGTVEDYTQVQRIARDAIKAVDTNIVVTSGGYAGMNHWSSRPGAFEAAMNDYPRAFDWFAYHMHDVFPQFYSDLHYQLAALQQATDTTEMPIVFTETGFDTRHGQHFQAQTLIKKMCYAAAIGAKSYCFYNLMDRAGSDEANRPGKTFGLISNPTGTDNFAAIEGELHPKESFVSVATAVAQLRRLPPLSIWAEGGAEYAFLFGVPNDHLVVGWRENQQAATPVWVVDVHGADVTHLDMYGNPDSVPSVEGKIILALDDPQYFLFKGGVESPERLAALVDVPEQIMPDAEGQVRIDLEVWNPLGQAAVVTAQVKGGEDVTVMSQPGSQSIASQGKARFPISVSVRPKDLGEITELTVTLSFEGLPWTSEVKIPILFNTINAVGGAMSELNTMHHVTNKQDYDPNSLHLLWGSPADLSVEAEFSIVDGGVSLKYTVVDNILSPAAFGEPILDGDSLEFAWLAGGATNHLEVAGETGTSPRMEFRRNGQSCIDAVVRSVDVSRDGTRTVYDVVLNAAEMGTEEVASIRFNFAAHDNDGEGAESWMSAAPGMGGEDRLNTDDFLILKIR